MFLDKNLNYHSNYSLIENDHLGDWSPEKDCYIRVSYRSCEMYVICQGWCLPYYVNYISPETRYIQGVDVLSYALIRLLGLPDLQPKNSTLMAMWPYQPHGWMRRCRVWIGGLRMFSTRLTRSRLAVKYWGKNKGWIHISNDCLLKLLGEAFPFWYNCLWMTWIMKCIDIQPSRMHVCLACSFVSRRNKKLTVYLI